MCGADAVCLRVFFLIKHNSEDPSPPSYSRSIVCQSEYSNLQGAGAIVTVTRISKATAKVKGVATVYTRNPGAAVGTSAAFWTEQAVMEPHAQQQVR
jgi:hypothetical protein